MNCVNTRAQLLDYSSGALAPADARRIREHLDSCPGCRAEYARLHTFESCLSKSLDDAPVLADVTEAVMSQIGPASSRPRRLVWAWGLGAAAVAACLLVMIWDREPTVVPQPRVHQTAVKPSSTSPKVMPAEVPSERTPGRSGVRTTHRQGSALPAIRTQPRPRKSWKTDHTQTTTPGMPPMEQTGRERVSEFTREVVAYVEGKQIMRIRYVEVSSMTPPDPEAATIERPPLPTASI